MAKIKNTGKQPRGFFTDSGEHVVVEPGQEAEFNMTEADFNKVKELAEAEDPAPYEVSGSFGGVKPKTAKEQKEADEKKAAEEAKQAEADAKAAQKEADEDAKAAEKKK